MADELAVLGIDPGRRWTAGVLRVGDAAVHGWTLGPVDADGRPDPSAVDDVYGPGALPAFGLYAARILDAIEDTVGRAAGGGRVMLACETADPRPGGRIPLADWLVPRQLCAAIVAYDTRTVMIRPGGHGLAHKADGRDERLQDHYPPALWPARGRTGGRPASWGPNEARRGERDHERAAYDIAGAAALKLATDAGTGAGAGAGG
jgi:hypothetical protein